MATFIRRRKPREHELGLEFTRGAAGVEVTLLAPSVNGIPLRFKGMAPECAIATARDLAQELGLVVAVVDNAQVWQDVPPSPDGGPLILDRLGRSGSTVTPTLHAPPLD
ncbi:hypothetical protein [Lutibaculum baratangense]|uniref:Uncharacterized protein n=1 Tax=Lutibaculum baratangense AMV1 TaxID=631454 RepID=V4QVZ3_9HYPH|nr:hypothetical protein [Lutibaculum baratangense]ESR23882.1 hypothetical protein N177_2827 [Lutibaculum baratangense AMV1]